MADPKTVNTGLNVPLRGSNVGTWDVPVNDDFTAIDGLFGGVQAVAVSSSPVTLSAPAGFTATPSGGPTQSQNAVIQFTGVLTANVTVTLPVVAVQVFENNTTGNFLLTLRAVGSGEVIALPVGARCRVYNDGTNVRFIEGVEGRPGKLEFEGGESSLPAWIAACTVRPYLLCDGSVYNIADFPALGRKFGNKFGGNGVTTFGVQDLRGRVPLAYDATGTRITTAGCGIDGTTMGAAGGDQNNTLVRANLPNTSIAVSITDPGHVHQFNNSLAGASGSPGFPNPTSTPNSKISTDSATTGISASFNLNGNVTQTVVFNVQPSLVAGVWLVKT